MLLDTGRYRGVVALAFFGLVLASPVLGGEVTLTLEFPEPTVIHAGDYVRIEFPETWNYGDPGEPVVPWRGVQVLLPPGEEVSGVELVPGEVRTLQGHFALEPGQPQYPLSFDGPVTPVSPDAAIYASGSPYPEDLVGSVSTQFLCGHGVGAASVCPIQYVPSTGEVSYYTEIRIRITTEPTERARISRERLLRTTPQTAARLARMVENPLAVSGYRGEMATRQPFARDIVNPADDFDYVIITNSTFEPYFQDLADFKSARGVRATIVLMSDILAEYSGDDTQDKIRNFITDAYSGWGTEYVLLGGDDEIIPHRGLYAVGYGTPDQDIAADLYYGALDGTWNDDGDAYWGEPGEDDLIPEVRVGRAAIDNATEVQNFINKTLMYQENPVLADCNQAIMMAELLWDEPTWGGDYKDEIKDGASTHGYTTVGFQGSDFLVSTLYDRDHGSWSKYAAIDSLNSGINLCNHLGHCNVTYALKMINSDVDSRFTNDGVNHGFFIIYTQGCYCNSFDNRDPYGNYGEDAIAEHFTTVEEAAVAFVGNTRYGWGQHESTNGSSQYFDRQFFDAIFDEDITRIGDCNDDSKVDNIPFISYGANRWCYYQLCVLGDPELDMWTGVPSVLAVDHPGVIATGSAYFTVAVSSAKTPVEGARVCLMKGSEVYEVDFTDGSGQVTFEPELQTGGWMTVTVTKHDFLPYQSDVEVVEGTPPAPPTGLAATAGNGEVSLSWDANPEPDVDYYIVYRSTLPAPTDSLAAVPAPQTGYVDASAINDTTYYYRLKAVDTEGDRSGYSVQVNATPSQPPVIFITHTPLTDTNDASHPYPAVAMITTSEAPVDPDSLFVVWETQTRGWESAPMTATGTPNEYLGHIPAQICGTLVNYYILAMDTNHNRETDPDLAPAFYHSFSVNFKVVFEDDLEADLGWTVGAPDDDATTGIWERCDPEVTDAQPGDDHTPGAGTHAYITQCEAGSGQGSYDVDGGKTTLFSPVFDLTGYLSVAVKYYRWYSNDTGYAPGEDDWTVEVTGDGNTWVTLESTNLSNRSWLLKQFDIGAYITITDQVQFRFIAGDFGTGSLVEAGVDDFQILGCPESGDTEPPTVTVLDPNGGEVVVGGGSTPYEIRWTSHDNVGVTTTEVLLSTDSGKTYPTLIASGVDIISPYAWEVPDMSEEYCRIRVVCRDKAGNEGSDESDGGFEIRSTTAVSALCSLPADLVLRQNQPNPFNPVTEIEFGLPTAGQITLEIFSVEGRLVTTLAAGVYDAGYHKVVWRGTDSEGVEVSSGVYFSRLVTGGKTLTRKMIALK